MSSQLSLYGNFLQSRKGCKYAKIPLISKIRLFKSVIEEGIPIKRISEKLQIKYSTAKTLVRKYKDQRLQIDLAVLQNETNTVKQRRSENLRAGYREICTIGACNLPVDDEASEMNHTAIISHRETPEYHSAHLQKSFSKVEVVSKTIRKN